MKRLSLALLSTCSALLGAAAPVLAELPAQPAPIPTNGSVQMVDGTGWSYVEVPGAKCRHGGQTGIGVRYRPGSKKVVITMQGGGACFSGATCAANLGDYDFNLFKSNVNGTLGTNLKQGIWKVSSDAPSATCPAPSKLATDYTEVYIPYCTGDFHAGNNPNTTVAGVIGPQQFVGYTNAGLYFDYVKKYIVDAMPTTHREVLLSGFSAGGFGATINAPQLRKKLPADVKMSVLNDSGPMFDNTLMKGCFQSRLHNTFGLARTVMTECGGKCTADNWLNPFFKNFLTTYPTVPFAFTSTTNDDVIQFFMGGTNAFCFSTPTEPEFRAGLNRIRRQLECARPTQNNVATYFFENQTAHCAIQNNRYCSAGPNTVIPGTAGDYKLQDWTEDLFPTVAADRTRPLVYRHLGALPASTASCSSL
jgi:Pectinacetylesterase